MGKVSTPNVFELSQAVEPDVANEDDVTYGRCGQEAKYSAMMRREQVAKCFRSSPWLVAESRQQCFSLAHAEASAFWI